MEILIILGIIYYAILLFKQCNKTPGELLAIIQNPEKHRIARMCLRGIIGSVKLMGLSDEAKAWAEEQIAKRSISHAFATKVQANENGPGEPFFVAVVAADVTEADLKAMMESVP